MNATIHFAEPEDLTRLATLIERVEGAPEGSRREQVQDLLEHGFTLVLPSDDGALAAAAHVEIQGDVGHVDLLVIAPEVDTIATERRLIAVADAVCEAYDCKSAIASSSR